MKTSFENYITNPGVIKGASINSQIKAILNDYKNRFDSVLVREGGEIAYFLYKDTKNPIWYIHLMIPSETTKNLYYDVVIGFDRSQEKNGNLAKDNCRFFSNDPAFMFTWAYAFNKADLLIDWLKPKLSKTALTKKPIIRNPRIETGYVKSLYFAYYYMKLRHLFISNSVPWNNALKLNKAEFLKHIMHSGAKLDDAKRIKEINAQKALEEKQFKNPPDTTDRTKYTSKRMKLAKTAEYARPVTYVGKVKTSTKIRNVGYIRRRRK